MKNILNYQTAQEFTSANDNNIMPSTWWYVENKDVESFNYRAVNPEDYPDYPLLHAEYRGQVGEINPGVAYIKESGVTLYNPGFPLMEFNDYDYETHPWGDFGITQELIDKYIDAAKNRLYPAAFNAFINNSPAFRIQCREDNDGYSILIDCGDNGFSISSNGIAKIISMFN